MPDCDPKDIALKSFFLGPQSENSDWVRREILRVVDEWFNWRRELFPLDGFAITEEDKTLADFLRRQDDLSAAVETLSRRFKKEVPKFSPRYIGHMVSELSLSGILGHVIALLHNPNIASKEAASVGEVIEKEAISMLTKMIGFGPEATGHFTSGGTIANFEAIWRARYRLDHWHSLCTYLQIHHDSKIDSFSGSHMGWDNFYEALRSLNIDVDDLKPYSFVIQGQFEFQKNYRQWFNKDFMGPALLVPGNKHYSWQKGANLMGFGDSSLVSIKLDARGKLSINDLSEKIETCILQNRPILMVVSVAGTTELGDVDPVDEVQDYLDELQEVKGTNIWHHVDAAYGGFYLSMQSNLESTLGKKVAKSFRALKRADSVTLDPHKLGYIPYSCGAIVVPSPINNGVSSFQAPYLENVENDQNTWSSTIEGSRSGSGAAATWLTGTSLGFTAEGLGSVLAKGIRAREQMRENLGNASKTIRVLRHCDTNIVCFSLAIEGERLVESNKRTEAVFRLIADGDDFSVSKTTLNTKSQLELIEDHVSQYNGIIDCNSMILIRTVLMNPFIVSKNTSFSYIKEFCALLDALLEKVENDN